MATGLIRAVQVKSLRVTPGAWRFIDYAVLISSTGGPIGQRQRFRQRCPGGLPGLFNFLNS